MPALAGRIVAWIFLPKVDFPSEFGTMQVVVPSDMDTTREPRGRSRPSTSTVSYSGSPGPSRTESSQPLDIACQACGARSRVEESRTQAVCVWCSALAVRLLSSRLEGRPARRRTATDRSHKSRLILNQIPDHNPNISNRVTKKTGTLDAKIVRD